MTLSATPPRPLELAGVTPELGSRALFPDLGFGVYLGHAAISPLSIVGRRMVESCLADVARSGVGSFPIWDAQRDRLRSSLAELIGAEAEQVALTAGTTRGVTDIALSLALSRGDEIVTYHGEFPANVTPWLLTAQGSGARVRFLSRPDLSSSDPSARILEETAGALRAGARTVAVSAVQFQTGFFMPLRELGQLCRSHGARLFVDAIQALGVTSLDVDELGIDALVGGAHKWLLGLEGAGLLYVRPEFRAELEPKTAGWLSHEDAEAFLFRGKNHLSYERPLKSSARVFEGSSANAAGFAALEAGVDICRALGPGAIFEHAQRYNDALEPLVEARGFRSLRSKKASERSCILAFELPDGLDLPALALGFRQKGIVVSSPDGHLRFAPHFSNHLDEIPRLVGALDEILKELG